ncbi:MAG: flippase-like domain-containing protein [Thermodesulfovibrionales bacterium]|nr:flippase-like domain-containing protein [Thermodesulfovibrionales bacterium]
MDESRKKITKYLFLVLKIAVSSGLIYLLFTKVGLSVIVSNISKINPMYFVLAMILYLLQLFISTNRWSLLIGQRLSFKRLYSLYLIGSFFGIFLPGLVGGDTVKAYYLNKMLKSKYEENQDAPTLVTSIASVFMDRYLGLIAMFIMVIAVLPVSLGYLKDTPFMWIMPLFMLSFAVLSFVFVRFRLGERFGFLANFYTYFTFYITKKTIIIKTIVLSFFTQLSGIIAVYILAVGLAVNVSFLSVLIFLPIIILVSFIPISIAGIGLREGAFVFFFGIIGVPPDASLTLSILWFLSTCCASLLGFVEYIRIKEK